MENVVVESPITFLREGFRVIVEPHQIEFRLDRRPSEMLMLHAVDQAHPEGYWRGRLFDYVALNLTWIGRPERAGEERIATIIESMVRIGKDLEGRYSGKPMAEVDFRQNDDFLGLIP